MAMTTHPLAGCRVWLQVESLSVWPGRPALPFVLLAGAGDLVCERAGGDRDALCSLRRELLLRRCEGE